MPGYTCPSFQAMVVQDNNDVCRTAQQFHRNATVVRDQAVHRAPLDLDSSRVVWPF